MRRTLLCSIFVAGLVTLASPPPALAAARVSVSVFHQTLAPYGRWVATASYGDVWAPSVAAGWQPYVNGEWYYTDCGWTWASSDPWGDIPFHYGTWVWEPPYGWVWVPGTIWAPAWVTWAYSDDYVGWAPVPPSFALTATGYVGAPVVLASTQYVFVPSRQFVGVRVASVRLPQQRNAAVFSNTTRATRFQVASGVLHNAGPDPQRIARVAGRRIEPVPVAKVGVRPVSLTESGVAQGRRLAVVAPKAERAAAVSNASKAPATAHARPNRNVEGSRSAKAQPAAPPRNASAEKPKPENAVAKKHVKTEKAPAAKVSSRAKPAPKPEKPEARAAKHPTPEKPRPEAVRHEPAPPEHVAAARPQPKAQAAAPHPKPQPRQTNPPKPHPQKPKPEPKNDGNGN